MTKRGYLDSGRIDQKRRTRNILIKAAADLIAQGRDVSISDIVNITKIGRTTVYRYFPTLDVLIANAALWKVAGPDQSEIDTRVAQASSPAERIDAMVVENDRLTNRHSREFRAMLRVSLDNGAKGQQRARVRYFAFQRALADLEKVADKATVEKLICALTLTVGIEAQIVLKEICLLNDAEAREVKRWVAKVLLNAAIPVDKQKPRDSRSRTKA
ncbi:MAG: TetR/AcrR family transcriptional regulator [Pseudorhodoplanes sp.]|uniref:TetR/AcrR family transcriptional regulator n=1 Tax=Pseudorhodoplanes sp. TaxID=1934341 RepID=UPI003D0FE702